MQKKGQTYFKNLAVFGHFSTLCMKGFIWVDSSLLIRSVSGPYFPVFGLKTEKYSYSVRMRANTYQKNSEYGQFSRSVGIKLLNKKYTELLTFTKLSFFFVIVMILKQPLTGVLQKTAVFYNKSY